ncbi:hypothetical protein [Mycobacterium sp. E2497]|uniref:PPE domain-containing protein n=1 Tax=Mycobacterium sp. E2497 TaxID=1834135 RepID=UPI000B11D085|nr:hypothetical protein [Mycobacterium sp. E2497]
MTQMLTLTVDHDELIARAAELEAPIPAPPSDNPQAPCALDMVTAAAAQLALSADNMRLYLGVGDRVRQRLAEALRNVAKAYEDVDESAGQSILTGRLLSAVTGFAVEPVEAPPVAEELMSANFFTPYYPVKEAAQKIAATDRGASFDRFADAWTAYQRTLLEAARRFRPFDHWAGDASQAVEANFDQQRAWLYEMADECATMAAQARNVASTQRWALAEHPTAEEIAQLDEMWSKASGSGVGATIIQHQVQQEYARLQEKSEEVLPEYEKKAALPLPPIKPSSPPTAWAPPAPPPDLGDLVPDPGNGLPDPGDGLPEPGNGLPDPGDGFPEPGNGLPDPGDGFPDPGDGFPEPGNGLPDPGDGFPDPGNNLPDPGAPDGKPPWDGDWEDGLGDLPTESPSDRYPGFSPMPAMPNWSRNATTGVPAGAKGYPHAWTGAPTASNGQKPKLSGGGIGRGGAVITAGPLQPAVEAEAAPGRPGATGPAAATAGAGRGVPGLGAATGGAGMGVPPVGSPGVQGNNAGRGRHAKPDEEALYTEERPWTEGVIGRRRQKGAEN